MTRKVDVAIIGGGLSGNLLARQLRRQVPEASVALYERSRERTYKVGESTVEIAAHYLLRRMGLSTYLYQEHLPKFGLRYFFDTEERDAELTAMSEIGSNTGPLWPSFQLDRARFEADLLEMNRADGVDVRLGARVKDLQLNAESTAPSHRFVVVDDEGEQVVHARWVVDATGRESMIAKQLDLRLPETSHRIAASWGRFRGVRDIDSCGDEAFLERTKYASRHLSTNHFMYDGYWIWFIPLRHGIMSLGVVQKADQWDAARHKPEGFLKFLREHRAVASLIEDAEPIDLSAFTQLAFRTKQFFGADRWATVGDSAAFADPFYSPGSDFIALENDLITDLIHRDLGGEAIAERTNYYNRFMQYRFDTTLIIYDGLYESFGSYELFKAKVYFDTAIYYNLLFDPYARAEHLDLRKVRTELRRSSFGLQLMGNFTELFRQAARDLKETGRYRRKNLGHYELDARRAFGIMEDVGAERNRREQSERNEAILAGTQKTIVAMLGDTSPLAKAIQGSGKGLYDAWNQLGTSP